MTGMKPGRNDPCSCGSGKKYKHCCEGKVAFQTRAPSSAELNQLGALYNTGRYAELENHALFLIKQYPDSGIPWRGLSLALQMQGKDALHALQKTAELIPGDANVHSNLGLALLDLGQAAAAASSFRRALKIKPDFAEVHSNLGYALYILGQYEDARASCRRALELKPDFAEAHNNLGNALKALGLLDNAIASYRHALKIKPDFAMVHNNLGLALQALEQPDDAEASYRRALEVMPDYVDAFNNLAGLLLARGENISALDFILRSLLIEDRRETKDLFVASVKHLKFTHAGDPVRAAMIRALSEPWCEPIELVRVSSSIVKLNRTVGQCIARAVAAWPQRLAAPELYGTAGIAPVSEDALLCRILESAPVCDLEMERFLTMVRFTLLVAATGENFSGHMEGGVPGFYSALAQQCFINEYVFAWTDNEATQACGLRDVLAAALVSDTQISVLQLLAVACYFPLHTLPSAARLLKRSWPRAVEELLTQQVREPEAEGKNRAAMPQLTAIDGEVSLQVQNQYEENPYPRWIRAAPTRSLGSLDEAMHLTFPQSLFRPLGKHSTLDILIAGCGTGQHPIDVAHKFSDARLLAIDLSLTSLGYAERKSQELGLTSIEFAQADIMKLGSLGRSFDVIESIGVLHHLADPLAGWRVLLSLLRPGGIMRLGFYSEAARRGVVLAREFIAEHGYGSTAEDIRRCRQELMNSSESTGFGFAIKSTDFFSTSACRDLLFHVQEHRMTLAGIDAFLRENNLQFLGFANQSDIFRGYRQRFPDDPAATNLANWQIFENENPDTFVGMYQFCIQKPGRVKG